MKQRGLAHQAVARLRQSGKLPEAIAAARKELALDRLAFAGRSYLFAPSLSVLADLVEQSAGLHEQRKEWSEAVQVRQEVIDLKTVLYSPSHWQTINARLYLKNTRRLAKFTPEQRARFDEGFELNEKLIVLYRQGKYREAVLVGQEALKLREQLLGEEHLDTILSIRNLAIMYELTKDQAHAGPLYRRVLQMRKKVLGEHHPDYASSLSELAFYYNSAGKPALAAPLYRQAMNLRLELFGERNLEYLATLRQLAHLYKKLGETDRAEELFVKDVAIRRPFFLGGTGGPWSWASA